MNKHAAGNETSSSSRRRFLKKLTGVSMAGMASLPLSAQTWIPSGKTPRLDRVNALLISATTVAGKTSLEHARSGLRDLYGERRRILLINFASLPEDRDAYAVRMQRDFARIDEGFEIASLHAVDPREAGRAIREAEGFFVSGGNTFLLLRELYDRFVVDLLRERVLQGVPYAGSSAGSNLAGEVIGTTNDFPMTDIPTRRSLGLFPGVYNPHHPDLDDPLFGSRQWKIGQYAAYNSGETVVGVTDDGMLRVKGDRITLLGEDAAAALVHRDGRKARVVPPDSRDVSGAFREVAE
ncbi:MAG: dipeptidase PepE [Oceanipulchritudo sp.]